MNKEHDRSSTADAGPMPDAGVKRGIVNLKGSQVNQSDLARGHRNIDATAATDYPDPQYDNPKWNEQFGGMLGRPFGDER